MGYGHLRAAAALADHLGTEVTRADRPPLAAPSERLFWLLARHGYHSLSRLSQQGLGSAVFGPVLRHLTAISDTGDPLSSPPVGATAFLDGMIRRGFGRGFADRRRSSPAPTLTTFYATALAAERHSADPVACVVTDSHVHRVWVARRPERSRIHYLSPVSGTADCLAGYGVPPKRIRVTGFPLPDELAAPAQLERNVEARVHRLRFDGAHHPGLVTIAVAIGGAGAQADHAKELITELQPLLTDGRLRLVLVAGTHRRIAAQFRRWRQRAMGSGAPAASIEVLHCDSFRAYYRRFNQLLATVDILWTKPSELVFYAALGLPLVLDDPMGDHEIHNRDLVLSAGAGLERPPAREIAQWLRYALKTGHLVDAAQRGRTRLPSQGTENIASFCSNPR